MVITRYLTLEWSIKEIPRTGDTEEKALLCQFDSHYVTSLHTAGPNLWRRTFNLEKCFISANFSLSFFVINIFFFGFYV